MKKNLSEIILSQKTGTAEYETNGFYGIIKCRIESINADRGVYLEISTDSGNQEKAIANIKLCTLFQVVTFVRKASLLFDTRLDYKNWKENENINSNTPTN